MAEYSVRDAVSRIRTATRASPVAVFTYPPKPWMVDAFFANTVVTQKAIDFGLSGIGGRLIGVYSQDDYIEAVGRAIQKSVAPLPFDPNIPT